MTVLILILALGVSSPQTSSAVEGGPLDGCSRLKTTRAPLSEKAEKLRLKSSNDPLTGQTDVLHYRLDFEVDPTTEYLRGTNTMTVKTLDDSVTAFRFWLHDVMSVSAVELDGKPVDWQRLDAEIIEVSIARTLAQGEVFELQIDYEGSPVSNDWMAIVFESYRGTPVISTLSEPWYSYTWWPVKEDSRDKATGELLITVPSDMTAVSNGVLADVDNLSGGRRRFHWITDYPMSPYLFAFSATHYNTFGATYVHPGGSMPVEFFVYPDSDTDENRALWSLSVEMLAVFGDLFGLYPFIDEKYAIYEFPFGGGMEHQTATGQGAFWESLTAHELAHQWWGDMITCESWHDIWLNEGFASQVEIYSLPEYKLILERAYEGRDMIPFLHLCEAFPADAELARLAYAQSDALVEYIQREYGLPGLQSLIYAYDQGVSCERGVEMAFGMNLQTLDKNWQRDTFAQGTLKLYIYLLVGLLLVLILALAGFIIYKTRKDPSKGDWDENESL